jgi:hypothetical protein
MDMYELQASQKGLHNDKQAKKISLIGVHRDKIEKLWHVNTQLHSGTSTIRISY